MENKPFGRPTEYNEKVATDICLRIATGESLRKICKSKGMPVMSTVLLWVSDGRHKDFSEQYNQACATRAEVLFEESLTIADNKKGSVNRDRLRVETRKWFLSKVLPKKFGDKIDMTSNGKELKSNTIILKDFSNEADS